KIQSTENKTGNTTGIISKVEENSTPIKNEENKSTNLMKHSTGIELPMLIVLILVLGCAIIIKYRRD
ncbi:hypothetical protein, partial [Methanobrevibacter sp.]|uniref:hypothetical protein n=1 Tax=Methanobrevibacter sp. TaxID=66852 RepID=UPI0026DEA83F